MKKFTRSAAILAFVMINTGFSLAQSALIQTTGEEKVTPLIARSLPDVPGRKAILVMVDFAPGQAAKPHEHPGSVMAYVLEGSILSQLKGQKAILYHQGQYWYEPPHVGHILCKNASQTQPAKILVWQLVGDHEPVVLPYKA